MTSTFWQGKRVLVTGGNGFLGKTLVPLLRDLDADVAVSDSRRYDLTKEPDVARLFHDTRPQLVIHLAADVGGIEYVSTHPASVFYSNALMNLLVMEYSRRHGVEKLLAVSSVNCYPEDAPVPFKEEALWRGISDASMRGYGMSKRMMVLHSHLTYQQYDLVTVNLILDSLYGPHDVFTPGKARVIPANIERCMHALQHNAPSITVWGTGGSVRDFVYVDDAAHAIISAMERVVTPDPINIGTGHPLSIKELIGLIAETVSYTGKVVWDTTKPDGQMARYCDISRARDLGIVPHVSIKDGLARTVTWYREQKKD